jgi:adenylate cyclase
MTRRAGRSGLWRAGRRGSVLVVLAVASLLASLFTRGVVGNLDGPLYDLALAGAARIAGPGPNKAPVVIVALDRRSLDSDELAEVPRVLMAPYWARLIDGLGTAKPRAVGFDIIFGFAAGRFKPGYDLPFIAALARNRGLVVLGRSFRTPVARPYFFALGANRDTDAVGNVEMVADSDGVFRTARAAFPVEGGATVPTLAGALARRAGGPVARGTVRLAPTRGLEATPTYALVDVLSCISQDPARMAAAFRDRIVLVGTTLPEEDRKTGPDRFLAPTRHEPDSPAAAAGQAGKCGLAPLGRSDPGAGTVPGVALVAGAVRALMGDEGARLAPASARVPAAAIASFVAGGAGFALAPWLAVAATIVLLVALFAIEAALLVGGTWLPMALPGLCAVAAVAVAYLARFLIEERRRRRVEHAFGHYLAPTVVERLVNSDAALRLGGELREVSVMFADLSGFTALSGRVGPERLMELTNRYLGIIAGAVDESGGYVDKFIGDAVMAVWGAPADEPDHAACAAGAALAIAARVDAARAGDRAQGEHGFSVKIGVNTGVATVGNVGAPKRYNYTAVGETVNIAARLEGVPGDYGCRIVLGPASAAEVNERFLVNELDRIRVKGKEDALAIFELIRAAADATDADRHYVAAYGAALAAYRAGRFAVAEAGWARLAAEGGYEGDSPPAVMARRAAALVREPPGEPWDGVWVRTSK